MEISTHKYTIVGIAVVAGSDGVTRNIDGGQAMNIDGKIVLCGRSDRDMARGYSGKLAELAIWDQSLSPAQAADIYHAVRIQYRSFVHSAHSSTFTGKSIAHGDSLLVESAVFQSDTKCTDAGTGVHSRCRSTSIITSRVWGYISNGPSTSSISW